MVEVIPSFIALAVEPCSRGGSAVPFVSGPFGLHRGSEHVLPSYGRRSGND